MSNVTAPPLDDLPPLPSGGRPRNPYPDLSRAELEQRLTSAEWERDAVSVRLSVAEYRLDVLRKAFEVLQELAEEEERGQ